MKDTKYIMVLWPYSQIVMEHARFNECYLVQAFDGQEHFDSAYFVPEDIYAELYEKLDSVKGQ